MERHVLSRDGPLYRLAPGGVLKKARSYALLSQFLELACGYHHLQGRRGVYRAAVFKKSATIEAFPALPMRCAMSHHIAGPRLHLPTYLAKQDGVKIT